MLRRFFFRLYRKTNPPFRQNTARRAKTFSIYVSLKGYSVLKKPMDVYVEYVFIDNFVIDYLILKLTSFIAGKEIKNLSIALCSFFGAVFALIFPLIGENFFAVPAKIAFGLLMVTAVGKFINFKDYLFTAGVFFGITFLTGGAIIGIFSLLKLDYSSEYAIGLAVIPVYILLKGAAEIFKRFKRIKVSEKFVVKTEITVNGVKVCCRGFFDTGNSLYDGLSPVIVVGRKTAEKFFKDPKSLPRFTSIAVETATGTERKLSVKNACVIIYYGNEKNIFNNVTVAIADIKNSLYDVILHPDLMEVRNAEYKPYKSVS